MKILVVKYSGILLATHLFFFWLLFYSGVNLPYHIPGTTIHIGGLLLLIPTIVILIVLNRALRAKWPDASLGRHLLMGTITCFIAELIFQLIRLPFMTADTGIERLKYFLTGVFGTSFFYFILAFIVALLIKRKRNYNTQDIFDS
jgi:hypothetical protein